MDRRQLLKLGGSATAGLALGAAHTRMRSPILDAHIHLFDPTRPGGVPWPDPTDPICHPALPDRYAKIATTFGIVGAIAIEASPLPTDNDWVLNLIEHHPIIVGYIGNLVPGSSSFAAEFERLHANPLFLGIRCGNLWNRDLYADSADPAFIADLRRLASAGLTMDTANPDPRLIQAVRRVSDQIPELRIVIDHLPHAVIPDQPGALAGYNADLRALAANPHIFVKLSEIPVRMNGRLVTDAAHYRDNLDAIWELFGESRLLFGSDWPNSDHFASYAETFGIIDRYLQGKGRAAMDKVLWQNSVAAYGWRPRIAEQHRGFA